MTPTLYFTILALTTHPNSVSDVILFPHEQMSQTALTTCIFKILVEDTLPNEVLYILHFTTYKH